MDSGELPDKAVLVLAEWSAPSPHKITGLRTAINRHYHFPKRRTVQTSDLHLDSSQRRAEYACAAAFLVSGREPSFVWLHTCAFHLSAGLTSPPVNQSPSHLRPLGDSNDTAVPLWGRGVIFAYTR